MDFQREQGSTDIKARALWLDAGIDVINYVPRLWRMLRYEDRSKGILVHVSLGSTWNRDRSGSIDRHI